GKTNLSHDGLNPAHVPYWWVNNPTLGEFCFTMIGRADIEGSKSNVAMNAWLPQASYPCGNFSDTSSFKFRRSKGSIGHAFTVRIRTENQNQTSFYPFVPHEISVLVELILGHLRYLLTDVPPQPNSPPDNVLRPDRPAEASLGSKRRGCYPASDSRIGLESSSTGSSFPADSAKPVPLAVFSLESRQGHRIPLVRTSSELAVRRPGKAPERAVPSPSPGRHEAVRSRHVSSSSSPPTVDGFGTGTPEPSPQSQSFSRSYGSILPTSLAYIVPSTRGCSPWRPDAVMSTTGRERHSVLRIFKGHRECTGHHATCGALPAAGPYLRLSRFQDVPPQPNSPPDNVLCPDRPAEASLGSKRRGCYPASDSRSNSTGSSFPADSAKPVPLAVVSLDSRQGHRIPLVRTSSELAVRRPGKAPERAVPSPSPGRHEAVRSRHVSSSSSPPTVDGGCSPWRPDAVMSTTGRERHSVLRIFKGHRECTGHHAMCGALPAAGPYLRLSRFQGFAATAAPSYSSRPGSCPDGRSFAPIPKSDEQFARQYRCGPPPEFPLASPRSGIVHHLSGPDRHAHTRTLLRRSRSVGCAPVRDPANQLPCALRDASAAPIRFPPDNFKHSLTLFSKSFSSLPRGTCSLSVSRPYLALDGIYRLIGAAFPNNPTRRQRLVVRQGPGTTGLSPSLAPLSRELGPGPSLRTLLQTTIRTPKTSNFQAGLFPRVIPPDLGSR
ncbi:unnamed protein product, partial [Brassica rapa subsp. trilocularis]